MRRIGRRVIVGAAVSVTILAVEIGWAWWEYALSTETTDNAYVHGDITAIAPKVAGYVAEVAVHDNQAVSAGDILVRIADEDYRAQRDRATASVSQVQAAIENLARRKDLQQAVVREAEASSQMAQADLDLAERQFGRTSHLLQTGAVSVRVHDTAIADQSRARAALARSQAAITAAREQEAVLASESAQFAGRLAEARAGLSLAEIALSETIIRAPVAGIVGNRRVRLGEYVRPGGSLLSIVPVDGVWVVANFKETQISRMRVGQPAEITVDGYANVRMRGTIDSLSPGSGAAFSLIPPDNATGNFVRIVQRVPVKIRLDHANALHGRLVPGMSVDVSVDLTTHAKPAPGRAPEDATVSLFREAH
ncbi:membrane fusion protein (multidrug efflux system) [Bradyrhizobium japonicum]|jgi:membrane fusion protein, multidrug efflux system|uniref:Membrane fusion protein (Multidrug efflux system) n=1 Tax=Bradyrhizobium elkanii TaxID=29448 RepID=A0ABV4FEA6_BRAEL|nr:HlyD family secretion protein [Bradyrhizobium elkanii]MBP2431067.1 membrane fusion protein (multidrug efflux system) [Bradyrhizobium elkanii]MCP1735590.1 membrane fusion protein (multidrug efflux system) [Bradyrhizobium elkanii]MCP1753390.1 membrane fusion protein (multidrug efflux system) [Bradyrhizobium elkanii]MCP1978910.1 membrane fusion protein (multidrug efflux system) [Bradyrhizobium elkanii]MCS3570931.1 membrane fusion protein (multidrug efflux system) [Bradyrhizobium elkanii]